MWGSPYADVGSKVRTSCLLVYCHIAARKWRLCAPPLRSSLGHLRGQELAPGLDVARTNWKDKILGTHYVRTHFRDIVQNPHKRVTILNKLSIQSPRSTDGIPTSGIVGSRRSSIDDSGSLSGLSGRGSAAAFNVLKKGRIRFARNPLMKIHCDFTTFYSPWSMRGRNQRQVWRTWFGSLLWG